MLGLSQPITVMVPPCKENIMYGVGTFNVEHMLGLSQPITVMVPPCKESICIEW